MTRRVAQPAGLISVLRDRTARLDERDDAALDLAQYDEPEALHALIRVASDQSDDELLLDSCGQSIAEIWARLGIVENAVLLALTPTARRILLGTLEARAPHLIPPSRKVSESE